MPKLVISSKNKLVLILLLALFIRLLGITSRSIWYDEAFSILISEQGPAGILHGTLSVDSDSSAAEEHPPAYYFLLWGWMQVLGNSVIAARAFSVIVSLVTIYFIYRTTQSLFQNENTALLASAMAALLPFQVHFAQEIRMYALLTLWLTIATYAFFTKRWAVFSIMAALAQYTHNLAAFYLVPLALIPLFQRNWKTLRSVTTAGLVSIILYVPWLAQLPAQFSKVSGNFWVEQPGVDKLFTLTLFYLPHLPLSNLQFPIGLLLALLTIMLASYQTFREDKSNPSKVNALWTAHLAFTPPLFLWLASQFFPIYIERALLPSHAMFCIWLAWAFTQTKIPRLIQGAALSMTVVAALIGIYQHVTYQGFPYGPYAQMDQFLSANIQPGGLILHSSKLSYLPSFYFDRQIPQGFIADPKGGSTDTLSPATLKILGLTSYEDIETATANADQVWLIIYQQSIDEYVAQGRPTHEHIEYMDEHFRLVTVEPWGDLQIYLYERE